MDRNYFLCGIIGAAVIVLAAVAAAGVLPHEPATPVVAIVYGSEKGDLSYTDSAYRGLAAAQHDLSVATREFTPQNYQTLPAFLNRSSGPEKPGLVITVGFQYTGFTRDLADQHPEIRFLAIDQSGTGSGNLRATEITSYGDSYLAGVLAATATKTGRVGIILGMKTGLLDTFLQGYTAGARAVNASIGVDHAYIRQDSPAGFMDPGQAGRIAEGMYRNGTDVIYTCAGASNLGAFETADTAFGRYVIGTDSDQSPLGPDVVLASAVKRVDRVVYTGIEEHLTGRFTGGDRVVGLNDGATALVYNPKFLFYNESVSAREGEARAGEEQYLLSRTPPVQEPA
jgi:basic membrane protein A